MYGGVMTTAPLARRVVPPRERRGSTPAVLNSNRDHLDLLDRILEVHNLLCTHRNLFALD